MDEGSLSDAVTSVTSQGLCRGAQIAWCEQGTSGSQSWGVDGLGSAVRDDSLFAVYCAGKPLLALCVAEMVRLGVLDYDDRLPDLHPSLELPDVTLRQLLDHTSGLHTGDGGHVKLCSSKGKLALALRARPDPHWDPTTDAGYSESIAWTLLALTIEARTAAPWAHVVHSLIIEPLGLDNEVFPVFTPDTLAATPKERLAVNCDLRGKARPLLNETGRSLRLDPNPGWGAFATARGMCALLHETMASADGPGPVILGEPSRGVRYDQVMQLEADNRVGMMVDLSRYGVKGAPGNTIGHTGLMGLTSVIHDLDRSVTACVTFVGLIDGPDSVGVRRPAVLHVLFDTTTV